MNQDAEGRDAEIKSDMRVRMESKESRLNIGFVGDHMPTSLPSAVGDRLTTLGLTVRGYPALTVSARVHLSAT